MDTKQQIQEGEYRYPYHYIPQWDGQRFSQTQHWEWGYRYLGGLLVVLDQLKERSFASLIDVGCGDGRFLLELENLYDDVRMLGIDYSARAIGIANALNPSTDYRVVDVTEDQVDQTFDVAVLIEVLEHIPPPEIDRFLHGVKDTLTQEGCLILTVPHTNSPLAEKHYQHFDSDRIRDLLCPHFRSIRVIPFDPHPAKLSLLERLPRSLARRVLGGEGEHFVVTNSTLNRLFFELYRRYYLHDVSEDVCSRICVVAER
jgi:SAM-dependent methyltransferase